MIATRVVGRSACGVKAGGPAAQLQQRGFAENLKAIQMRISSTANIQKITKSMKMVSAAKLRGDTDRLINGRPFGAVVNSLFSVTPGEDDTPVAAYKKPLYVMISSDRGLCGGVNNFVAKEARLQMEADIANGADPQVFVAGDKASAPMQRLFPDRIVGQINERSKTPANFSKALVIADRIISARPDADAIKIVFNRFKSAVTYHTVSVTVPNFPVLSAGEDEASTELPFPLNKYEGELESQEESTMNVFEYGLAVQLYSCIIESATSEQSSRMAAMDNASKNAADMVNKLTIRYNRARQAKITTELIEIISGAESLKN